MEHVSLEDTRRQSTHRHMNVAGALLWSLTLLQSSLVQSGAPYDEIAPESEGSRSGTPQWGFAAVEKAAPLARRCRERQRVLISQVETRSLLGTPRHWKPPRSAR